MRKLFYQLKHKVEQEHYNIGFMKKIVKEKRQPFRSILIKLHVSGHHQHLGNEHYM